MIDTVSSSNPFAEPVSLLNESSPLAGMRRPQDRRNPGMRWESEGRFSVSGGI
jgi:hypothetical protein